MPRTRDEGEIDLFKHRIAVLERMTDDELKLFSIDERPICVSRRLLKFEKLAQGRIPSTSIGQQHFVDVLISKFPTLFLYGEGKLYLNCPFEDKDEVRLLGASWSDTYKKWYAPDGSHKYSFIKWWPTNFVLYGEKYTPETPYEFAFLKYLTILLDELEKEFERSDDLEKESYDQQNYVAKTRRRWKQKKDNSGEIR
jgi:hypothetical protein